MTVDPEQLARDFRQSAELAGDACPWGDAGKVPNGAHDVNLPEYAPTKGWAAL